MRGERREDVRSAAVSGTMERRECVWEGEGSGEVGVLEGTITRCVCERVSSSFRD